MKSAYIKVIVAINLFALFAYNLGAQTPGQVQDHEYEVFSAFINQMYLSDFYEEWYTLNSTKPSVRTNRHNKIGEVVIAPFTHPETSHGYSSFANVPYRNQIPKELFDKFIDRNDRVYDLDDKFHVRVPHSLSRHSIEESQAMWNEIERRKINYDDYFKEKHPKAAGTLLFFRVAFDEKHENALLGVWQQNVPNAKGLTESPGGHQLILLSKTRTGWIVNKAFPEPQVVKFNVSKCAPISRGLSLALGSTSIRIQGLRNGKCQITQFHEIEGGYTKTDCFVPRSLGEIFVTGGDPFPYSKKVSPYCQKPKTGNIFLDQFKLNRKIQSDRKRNHK